MSEIYDILLIIAPPWGIQTPPVGIAYLAEYLKTKDIRVTVFDVNIYLYHKLKETKSDLWHPGNKVFWTIPEKFSVIEKQLSSYIDDIVTQIAAVNTALVGFSVFSDNRIFSAKLIERLKGADTQKKVIAGGVGCYAKEERDFFYKGTVDHFVVGSGEQALYDIVQQYKNSKAKGLKRVYVAEEKTNLNKFPFPTYSDFNLSDYADESLAVSFSRGCPMKCVYCNDRYVMGKYNERSPENMVDELLYHIEHYQINEFAFNDLQINANLKRLDIFLDLILKNKLDVKWTANMMPRKDMDSTLIRKIKRAGCSSIIFGVESGSDSVLKLMKRSFSVTDSETLLQAFFKAGLAVWVNFIVGFPGETEDDFLMTLDFIRRNKKYISKVSVLNKCNIVQGSDLYKNANAYHIFWPIQEEYKEVRWASVDGNVEALRDLRLQRFIIELTDLDIELLQSNVKYTDPWLSDERLYTILGSEHSFQRDTNNLLVNDNHTQEGKVVNHFLKTINEIIHYKELQIQKVIRYKEQEVSAIVDGHAKEKDMLVQKYDEKIKNLVKDYLTREKNIVADSNERIERVSREKDREFEQKFDLFKQDMEKNILQKEEELKKASVSREEEVARVLQLKDKEIESLSQTHKNFVEDLVFKKDKEINTVNDKYNSLLQHKDTQITNLSRELDRIYQSKWFKFRQWIRTYLSL